MPADMRDLEGTVPRNTTETLDISVILPVYNGEKFIVDSLPPLIAMQARGEVREVLVIDDCSTDSSARIAEQLGAKVITSEARSGPAAARNRGASSSMGEVLWFVDTDVVVHDTAVSHLQRGFSPPGVVAVFGSYDDRPAAQSFLSQYKNLVHHYYHNRGRQEASTFWAGCGAVRREAFLQVGGYDQEKFTRPSVEDIELGHRLRAAGGRIRLIPEFQGTHLKVWRLVELIRTEIVSRALPWSRLMLAQTGLVDDLNVSRPERMRAVAAGIFVIALISALAGWIPWWAGVLATLAVAWANRDLLALFHRRRGVWFAIRGLAFHQLYYLYSGFSFVYAWLELGARNLKKRWQKRRRAPQ
jgi:glycosyltransferase involved in cell wall biosynthesis